MLNNQDNIQHSFIGVGRPLRGLLVGLFYVCSSPSKIRYVNVLTKEFLSYYGFPGGSGMVSCYLERALNRE